MDSRLVRIRGGNLGDHKNLKDGVYELRIHYGGGLRVYFGLEGQNLVIILCGGDKSSQKKDVLRAKEYWSDYLDENG